jgi:hypothetical protein
MKWLRSAALGLGAVAVASYVAHAAGLFPGFPIVGQAAYCTSISGVGNPANSGTGQPAFTGISPNSFNQGIPGTAGTFASNCNSTAPAGPVGLTGKELIPADTGLASGQQPQTVLIPSALLVGPDGVFQGSGSVTRNLIRNGDISVNPFQSGTSQAADITNTVTTTADGFRVVGGGSSAINWSSQTGATDIVANQFTKSLRFQRKSANADTAQICQINVLTSQDSVALQGQNFVYSFWIKAGANLSSTNGNVVVTVATGTGSDQSAANFKAGTWTGQANAITAAADSSTTGTAFPVSVTTGQATVQALPTGATAAWVQVWVSGAIPTTATQVGTSICYTPVGTAGTNDWIETSNHQLEITVGSVVTPSSFEHHTAAFDLAQAQRFLYTIVEGAAAPARGMCRSRSVTTCSWNVVFPVPMRAVPTMTYANGFAVETTVAGGTLNNCTLAADTTVATATASVLSAYALCTATTVPAAGTVDQMYDNGGTGKVTASAEL